MTTKAERSETLQIVTWEEILYRAGTNPITSMDEWPIDAVWRTALHSAKQSGTNWLEPEWIKCKVTKLIQGGDRIWWPELLDWYLFQSSGFVTVEALEFAIGLVGGDRDVRGEVSKLVCGRIRKETDLYWFVSGARGFLERLLKKPDRGEYYRSEWHQIERAARCAIAVGDTTLLPQIEELLSLHEKGELKPFELAEDRFVTGTNAQFLKDAARFLRQEKEEQQNWKQVVAQYLRDRAGLSGDVSVRLKYPERVRGVRSGELALDLVIEVEPTEEERLAEFLGWHFVMARGYGFWKEELYQLESYSCGERFSGLCCYLTLPFQQIGAKRFSLSLVPNWGNQRPVAYVTCCVAIE